MLTESRGPYGRFYWNPEEREFELLQIQRGVLEGASRFKSDSIAWDLGTLCPSRYKSMHNTRPLTEAREDVQRTLS